MMLVLSILILLFFILVLRRFSFLDLCKNRGFLGKTTECFTAGVDAGILDLKSLVNWFSDYV